MNDFSISENNFDLIAFETVNDQVYAQSQAIAKFSKNYKDVLKNTFEDGKYDSELKLEPELYQWKTPEYKRGYLAGTAARIDDLFSSYR